jgi:CubicO group peptidase (beta-lactamase class C family)
MHRPLPSCRRPLAPPVRRAAAGRRLAGRSARLGALVAVAIGAPACRARPAATAPVARVAPVSVTPLRVTPDARLDAVVRAAESAGFAGTVLVAGPDRVAYARSVGLADRAARRPHALDVPWRWASVTKQVTAVLVLQQVEAGRLGLAQTVAEVLPEFAGPTARQVTVRQLLHHTSGLPNPDDTPKGADGVPAFYRPATAAPSTAASVHAAALGQCGTGEARAPGERFAYNNCDYLVLGAMLERVTGLSYAALVDQRLARPLGLASLRVQAPGVAPRTPVIGYLASGAPEPPFELGAYGAAGALHGTVQDLLAFDRALLAGRLLAPASRDTLWRADPKLGYAALGAWVFPASLAGCAAPLQVVERRGAIGGVQVRNVLVPDRATSVIVFANTEATEFGEVWQRRGLTYELLRAALCA